MRMIVTLATAVAMLTTTALANPPLREVKNINDGLLAVGLADAIRKNCGSISGRVIRGLNYLKSLENDAKGQGYSRAEIRAFVKNRAEKNRLKAKGEVYLANNGVKRSEPETFCILGRKEISKSSSIGVLLRNR